MFFSCDEERFIKLGERLNEYIIIIGVEREELGGGVGDVNISSIKYHKGYGIILSEYSRYCNYLAQYPI